MSRASHQPALQFRLRTIFLFTLLFALLFALARIHGVGMLMLTAFGLFAAGAGILHGVDYLAGDASPLLSPVWAIGGLIAVGMILLAVFLIVALIVIVLGSLTQFAP